MMVNQGFVLAGRSRCPTGVRPGQYVRASVSLTMATPPSALASVDSKPRPWTIAMPIVSKKPDITRWYSMGISSTVEGLPVISVWFPRNWR